ncbi:hypothetical protein HY484_00365 [Candidatus Woesearchaeota archaeon]|nr:hypothetical protein [Candidatus Woesearchaeota archaeon]
MDDYKKLGLTAFVLGAGFGVTFGTFLGNSYLGPIHRKDDKLQRFERENKPAVVRFYRIEASDALFVETEPNKYVPLKTYLETNFQHTADSQMEKASIEKAARWYDE